MTKRMFLSSRKELQFNEISFNVLDFPPVYFNGDLHQLTNLKFKHWASGEDVFIFIKTADYWDNEVVLFRHIFDFDCDQVFQNIRNIPLDVWEKNKGEYIDYKYCDINDIIPILRII
jgi:hypothetical protein